MSTKSAIVEPGMEPQVETLDDSDATFSNLIVNYLPLSFRERHIRKLFSTFGKIESCRVMRFAQDGRTLSKGYGFVDFSTRAEAEAAIQGLNGKNVLGKNLKVGFAKPSGQRVKSNLFVTHIPSRWTESDLDEAFGKHGKIIERRILRDQDGGSRRSAFVRFDNNDQARKAIEKMNMWRPNMVDQPILVRVATEHESKRNKGPDNANKATRNTRNRRKKANNVSKRHEDFAAPKRPTSTPMRNQVAPQRRGQAAPAHKAPLKRDHIDMPPRQAVPEYRNERRNCNFYAPRQQKPYHPHTQSNMQAARSPQAAPERRRENWRVPSSRYEFDNDFDYLNYDNMGFDMIPPAPHTRADFEAIRDPDVGWEGIYRDPSFLSEEYNPNFGPDPYYPPRHSISERALSERNPERSAPKAPPAPPAQQQPGRTSGTEVHLVNFPLCLDKAAIMNMSSAYGEVMDVRIAIDNNGRSIRLATLCFTTVEAADRAIAAFDGCTIAGCVIHCSKANRV